MDIVACVFELIGAWLISGKNIYGFPVLMIGNCFWLLAGKKNRLWGLVAVSVIFFFINIRGIVIWQQ